MNPDSGSAPPARETPYLRPAGYAEHYRDARFRAGTGAATDRREAAALAALLAHVHREPGTWLDVPCGTGRMSGRLPQPVLQVDRSVAMLRAAGDAHARVCASAAALPFRDGSFAGCLCLRLLHHVPDRAERTAILAELRRVTRGPLIVSFFDALSLQHARRVILRRFGRTRSGRCAVTWRTFRRELVDAGWNAVATRPLRRFVSEQWLVLATPATTATPRVSRA